MPDVLDDDGDVLHGDGDVDDDRCDAVNDLRPGGCHGDGRDDVVPGGGDGGAHYFSTDIPLLSITVCT